MAETRTDAQLLAGASREPELFGVVFDRHFATIHRYLERRIGRDGAVVCAWIDRWVTARRAGDEAAAHEAVDAMATSTSWPILREMDEEGDYPEVVWELVAAMETNEPVPVGRPMKVKEACVAALGCP